GPAVPDKDGSSRRGRGMISCRRSELDRGLEGHLRDDHTKPPIVTIDELNDVLAASPFLNPYVFRAKACGAGECPVVVPLVPALERPGGIVSGMTLMGAADVAMWLAIMTLRGVDERWVTSDMKTAFLKSAREEDILCTARILKLG